MSKLSKLLSPLQHGGFSIASRVAVAPMTRCRAINNTPTAELEAVFYSQRAGDKSSGLVITEGTSPSPNGCGYARMPGIWNEKQIAGWKSVADAVHAKNGKIFMQLMHCGRVAHPDNLPAGAKVVAPSAVKAAGDMYVDNKGMLPLPVPEALTADALRQTQQEFVTAAKNVIKAGLDGVELHSANGYLLEQFFRPSSNLRTDNYGGSVQNRARFLLETVDAVVAAIGIDRVGLRISPVSTFNDVALYPEIDNDYAYLAGALSGKITYLHIMDASAEAGQPGRGDAVTAAIRKNFKGTLILAGGYTAESAEKAIQDNKADVIAFGRPFIANPDLIQRWKTGAALAQPDFNTFYTPGPKGYIDYPALS